MDFSTLANSSIKISKIAFGCMSLPADEKEAAPLIDRAIAGGINFFDTADLYENGANEERVGRILKNRRKHLVLATKVGNQWRQDGSGWDWNPSPKYILEQVDKSLSRLQTDYIDLYQLHGGTMKDPFPEIIETFEKLKSLGKIRAYGISSIRPQVIGSWVNSSRLSSVMMQYSLLDRRPEQECLPLLKEKGIGVLVRGSIAQGLLVNKPAKPYLGYSAVQVEQMAATVKQCSTSQRSPAQTSIRYALHHPAVASIVVGIHKPFQLEEALAVPNTPPLTPQEITQLTQTLQPIQYEVLG